MWNRDGRNFFSFFEKQNAKIVLKLFAIGKKRKKGASAVEAPPFFEIFKNVFF